MAELGQLDRHHQDFERRHVRTYVISVEDADKGRASQADFPHLRVVSDSQRSMIDTFRVLHPGAAPGGEDTAAPTTILVDGAGTVRWIFRPTRHIERLSPVELLAAVDEYTPAQVTPPPEAAAESGARTSDLPATGPVPVPVPSERALEFYRSGNVLWVVNTVWALLVPSFFLVTGLSARLRDLARRIGRKWFFTVGLYFTFFSVLTYLLSWPLDYYEGFIRAHDYGLSNQTFGKWLGDGLKSLAVTMVMGVVFLWVPYLLLAKSPRRWWLYLGLLAVPFAFFLILVTPIWIEPLFNDFHEMKDKALEAKILALAERASIEGSRVYQVDKSVDTKAVNAYVTGFLTTKRVVLWDTLLDKLNEREVLFVMGHEMGHYVLGHIVQGVFVYSGLVLIGLFLVHLVAGALLRRYHGRFGFDRLADVASLPLMLLVGHICLLALAPIGLAYSRYCEHEADRFGLEITQDNHAAATAHVKLQTENLGNPRPGWLYRMWRSSHPPGGERIDFANKYHPWDQGEPLRYGSLFRKPNQ